MCFDLMSSCTTGSFTETQLGEVRFPEISAPILEKVCQYFYWSLQFASGKETEFHIEPEMTLELMMAANYLHTWCFSISVSRTISLVISVYYPSISFTWGNWVLLFFEIIHQAVEATFLQGGSEFHI
jgi:hypothetical protein